MSIHAVKRSKKNDSRGSPAKMDRILVTVTVLGSAGPLRFVVKEEETVARVIEMSLRSYAREGRLPVLGSNVNDFVLYSVNASSEVLSPRETIGSSGGRNFALCRKQLLENWGSGRSEATATGTVVEVPRKSRGDSWRAWFNRSRNLKVSSH